MVCVCTRVSAQRIFRVSLALALICVLFMLFLRIVVAGFFSGGYSNVRFEEKGIPTFPSQTWDAVGYAWFLFPIAFACSALFRVNISTAIIVYIAYCCAMLYSYGSFTTHHFRPSRILSYRLSFALLSLSVFYFSDFFCWSRRRTSLFHFQFLAVAFETETMEKGFWTCWYINI